MASTPIETLRNALEVCEVFEHPDVAAVSAKQQLPRIRALIATAISQLSTP